MNQPKKRLKILFLAYEFPTSEQEAIVSGEVKNPYSLAFGLAERGHYLHVLSVPFLTRTVRRVSVRKSGAFDTTDIPEGRGWAVVRYVWRAANVARVLAHRQVDYDVVHAEAPALALGVIMARLLNWRLRGVRLVTSGHGTNLPEADADADFNLRQRLRTWNARLVLPVDRLAFSLSDVVVSVSDFQREELVRLYGVRPDRISVIHNGVDLRRYAPSPSADQQLEQKLLFVGRLVPKKGLQHILSIMPTLISRFPNVRLEIVGGSEVFDTYGSHLRAQADALGISDRVMWRMAVPEALMPEAYRSAAVGVFPSEGYESLPTVVLEAMACGIPVVATRSWGTPEALGDDHPGLIAERDQQQLIDVVSRFLLDHEVRAAIIEEQSRRVRSFSLENMVNLHEEAYENDR